MLSRNLFILATITVTTVVTCWLVVGESGSKVARGDRERMLIFPELQHQLADVADIEVTRANGTFVLSRREGTWANMGLGGFPAIPARVENTLIAMASMQYIAPKTKRSKLYYRLQVEDVSVTAKSTRLTFRDSTGASLADVIIGKPEDALNQRSVYVRLPGNAQTWLATGVFDVRHDAVDWSDRSVVDYDARSLNALTVRRRDGESVAVYRNQPQDRKMKLKNQPAGSTIEHQYQIDYMAGLLQRLNFIDAKLTDAENLNAAPTFEIIARHKNHLVVTLRTDEPMPDGSVWVWIDAKVTNDSQASNFAKQEVARIQSNFSGWSIKLPRKFANRLEIRLDDIIKLGTANLMTFKRPISARGKS